MPWKLQTRWIPLLCGDLFAILLVPNVGIGIAAAAGQSLSAGGGVEALATLVAGSWLTALYFEDLYVSDVPRPKAEVAIRLLNAASLVFLFLVLVTLLTPKLSWRMEFVITYTAIISVVLAVWRLGPSYAGLHKVGVAIVGDGECATYIARDVRAHQHLGYRLLGFVESCPAAQQQTVFPQDAFFLSVLSMEQVSHSQFINIVVVACDAKDAIPPNQLLSWRLAGKSVVDCDTFVEGLTGRVEVSTVQESWLAFAPGFRRPSWELQASRLVDVLGASLILVVTLPLSILTAIAIKLESSGPLFYSQERVGKNGNCFRLYKFRSMCDGAEKDTGPVWARVSDSRVTRTGRIIRRLRIDELPQLLNVFKGDMSLVGPRPERPELLEQLALAIRLYKYRLSVKPGITGWAQICYPYGASVEDAKEKLCYELYYIKNWSLAFDLQILLQTVKVVLFGRGAR